MVLVSQIPLASPGEPELRRSVCILVPIYKARGRVVALEFSATARLQAVPSSSARRVGAQKFLIEAKATRMQTGKEAGQDKAPESEVKSQQ